ncbi:DUF11 domain-containing protein [Patescibacteria group bacterium]|nr:DUF11 domain-containing protein [Patescibacteria group bacterium]
MKLDELKRKIYKPEAEFEERLEFPEEFQSEKEREKVQSEEWEEIKEREELSAKRKKYLKMGGIAAVAIFLVAMGFLFWRGLFSFDKNKVDFEIRGPESVVSGDEVKYFVRYKNNTKLELKDIELIFYYPENSVHLSGEDLIENINLPNLAAGGENQIELPARLIGLKGENKAARAELNYYPGRISSLFFNEASFTSVIVSVPLMVSFDLPDKLVSGQFFDFSLIYSNQAEVAFDDLQIQIEYPSGFNFQSSVPSPSEEDKIWSLEKLISGEQGKISVRGDIQGEEGEVKLFEARLGLLKDGEFVPYAETTDALQISVSPLFVSQKLNEKTDYIARAGEDLDYQIIYQNTTDVGIRNVNITSKLEGAVLDFAELSIGDKGSFNGENQTITWNASNLPALEYLASRQEGVIEFSLKVKDSLPVFKYDDKNFEIINTVKIDSSETPLSLGDIQIAGQSELVTKVASQLSVQARGYYYDDLISNSGPIPPKVGQETTYTLKWQLTNAGNDLSQVVVEAYLPPHVKWLNNFSPSSANLKYSPQTGKLVWNVGNMSSATGILSPVEQAAFQISITPSLAHLGSLVELIGQSKVIVQDNFAGLELTEEDDEIDTDLPDEPEIDRKEGTVIK